MAIILNGWLGKGKLRHFRGINQHGYTWEWFGNCTINAAELKQMFAGVFVWQTWGIPTWSEESLSLCHWLRPPGAQLRTRDHFFLWKGPLYRPDGRQERNQVGSKPIWVLPKWNWWLSKKSSQPSSPFSWSLPRLINQVLVPDVELFGPISSSLILSLFLVFKFLTTPHCFVGNLWIQDGVRVDLQR